MDDSSPQRRAWLKVVWGALFVGVLHATPVHAHKAMPVPLAFWGGFAVDVSGCQRTIGHAAERCARTAWRTRDVCLAAQLAGNTCDSSTADAAVSQAHLSALNAVDSQCAGNQPSTLSFASTFEIETDVDTFCLQLEESAVSAVYGPAARTGIGADEARLRRCTVATTRATTKLLRSAFASRCRVLDRIATLSLSPTTKQAAIDASTARIARARDALRSRLVATCPEADFVEVYGRGSVEFLTRIAQLADCLGGQSYVQNAVLCPMPVCGNGMQEAGEQCDDGNSADGDGCHHDCTRE